jgi:hypothetical protein
MKNQRKEELDKAIMQLMTPERQEELKEFFKNVPPVFQRFFFRFLDVRDSVIINFIQDDEKLAGNIADKVYDQFAKTFKTYSETLERLCIGQDRIIQRLEKAEAEVTEGKKQIAEHQRRLDEKKLAIQNINLRLNMIKPESIKAVSNLIIDVEPRLVEIAEALPEIRRVANWFKAWKVAAAVVLIMAVWFLIHYLFF